MDVFRRTDENVEYCKMHGEWVYENPKRENHGKILGEECLIQSMLLGMCGYMVCKQCGTSSGAIFFQKKLKEVYYV